MRADRPTSQAARRTRLRTQLATWQARRATAPLADLSTIDADGAALVGLPTLAAIHRALAELTTTPTPRETRVLLDEIRLIARGEATLRVRRVLADHTHDGVPGVAWLPQTILESQYGASGRGRPPRSRRGGAGAPAAQARARRGSA